MNARYPYLFALALVLPLASCHFVGARPDFSVIGDALSPVEPDSVYVESKPTASTKLASYTPPAPAATAPQKPSFFSGLFSQRQQAAPQPQAAPKPAPYAQVQPAATPAGTTASALYTVQPGDSLSRIARAHRVPLGSLASVNGIDLQNPLIKPGQQLRIPQGGAAIAGAPRGTATPAPALPPAAPVAPAPASAPAPAVQPVPAPAAAASTVPQLKPALHPTTPVPAPAPAAQPATPAPQPATAPAPKGQYRVCAGDTLYRIARKHGISLAELLRANNLSEEGARNVRVGTLLTIPAQQP